MVNKRVADGSLRDISSVLFAFYFVWIVSIGTFGDNGEGFGASTDVIDLFFHTK